MIEISPHPAQRPSAGPQESPIDVPQRAAYQGAAGAFGEGVVQELWHGSVEALPVRTFDEAIETLLSGGADWAVLPTWNSAIGPVREACAVLDRHAQAIVCESSLEIPVQHCLLGLPGTSLGDVRYVGSHPAALAQCSRLFQGPLHLVPCDAFDTAGAASELAAFGQPAPWRHVPWYADLGATNSSQLAVIAGVAAARRYGLCVLREQVQDDRHNVTRFAVVRCRRRTAC